MPPAPLLFTGESLFALLSVKRQREYFIQKIHVHGTYVSCDVVARRRSSYLLLVIVTLIFPPYRNLPAMFSPHFSSRHSLTHFSVRRRPSPLSPIADTHRPPNTDTDRRPTMAMAHGRHPSSILAFRPTSSPVPIQPQTKASMTAD
jgi:hypothetical protein